MILYTNKWKIPFQVDDDDLEVTSYYSWRISCDGYPTTTAGTRPRQYLLRLHCLLGGKAPLGLQWDHRNRDKLDNRRVNLRLVTAGINMRNKGLQVNNHSGVRGVFQIANGRWKAQIKKEGKLIYLGYFLLLDEAVQARKAAEEQFWGDAR